MAAQPPERGGREEGPAGQRGEQLREEEIVQIVPAPWDWYAYGQDEQGAEFLAPVALWALVESSESARRVVGLSAHGNSSVSRVEDLPGFVEYRYVSEEGGS